MSTDAIEPLVTWRQYLVVRGESLRLLQSVSNLALRDPTSNNTLTLEGDGPWFPSMHGVSWAAMCCGRQADDVDLNDLTPVLYTIFKSAPMCFSDAPRAEIEAFFRTYHRSRP